MGAEARERREREFYEAQAEGLRAEELPPRPPDEYERALLGALGPLEGLRVLELGCGRGDLALELLARGARLTALDLSPAMLELARARAARFRPGAEARFAVAPAERTGLESGSFERAAGKWILHHADVGATARELARVLRWGGRAAFFENQDRNPLLRLARRRLLALPGLARVGTADERPLSEADVLGLLDEFDAVERDYPSLYLLEALSRALGHRGHARLRALDAALWRRVPRLRPYGWHVLLVLERGHSA